MKPTCETVSFHKSCRPAVATLYLIRSPVYITVEHTLATNLIKVNSIEGVQSRCRPAVATLYLIRSPVYITVEHTLPTNLIKVNSIEGVQSRYRTMQFRKMSLDSDCKKA